MLSLILVALIPAVFCQEGLTDPCMNRCKFDEVCIGNGVCLKSSLFNNLMSDTPVTSDTTSMLTPQMRPVSGTNTQMRTDFTTMSGTPTKTGFPTMTGTSGMTAGTPTMTGKLTMTGTSGMTGTPTMTGFQTLSGTPTMTGFQTMNSGIPTINRASSTIDELKTFRITGTHEVKKTEDMTPKRNRGKFVSVKKEHDKPLKRPTVKTVQPAKPLIPTVPLATPTVVQAPRARTFMRDEVTTDTVSLQDICNGLLSGDKVAYPFDNSRFVICNPPGNGMVMSCPPSLRFNTFRKRCDYTDAEPQPACLTNPCQNGGLCFDMPNYEFKCDCQNGFTGDRCEKGLDPCSLNPCGPRGICKTFGFLTQDVQYYCICDNYRSFGLSCDTQVFTNPCMNDPTENYYAVPFSQSLFIHCESQIINIKACTPPLIWSNEIQQCDRPPQLI